MTLEWVAAAAVIAFASLVLGLAGFGNGLVAMGLLPLLMSPATAIIVLTIYTIVFTVVIFVPVRHHVAPADVIELVTGTVLGTPIGVWVLATVSASTLTRLIGGVLVIVVLLEWFGAYPERLRWRGWGLGTAAGMLLFNVVDQRRFRPIVFLLLFASGLALLARG